jgi:hypothetical protein
MRRFKVTGRVRITYEWLIDETIEVEDGEGENDAISAVTDELDPAESIDTDYDLNTLDVEELDESGEATAQRRARELAMLAAWNSGQPIAG